MADKARRVTAEVRPQDRWIQHVSVEGLFGRYDYDLDWSALSSKQVLLLYGDNGAGKTTLLQLVFHLLNEENSRGHRTHIANVIFRNIRVELNDGSFVEASRRQASIGAYELRVHIQGGKEYITDVRVNKKLIVPARGGKDPRRFLTTIHALGRLRLRMFFVTDQRELLLNGNKEDEPSVEGGSIVWARVGADDDDDDDDDEQVLIPSSRLSGSVFHTRGTLTRSVSSTGLEAARPQVVKSIDQALLTAFRKTQVWASAKFYSGSRQGEADASVLYADLLRNFVNTRTAPELDALVNELTGLADRSAEYAKYGFPTAENIRALAAIVPQAPSDHPMIARILQPYVETLRARLDALQPVHRALADLVNTINSFYRDKEIEFTIGNGVRVRDSAGNTILPLALSSGEKQLLLLFCNAVIATDDATVFFIDEPELSLNPKWQRQLVNALLKVTQEKNIQFILATHSFEILAQHRANVVTLRHGDNGEGTSETNASGTLDVPRA